MSRVWFAYAACALIWGTTWFAIRVCLTGYPTFAAAGLRFVIAAALLAPFALRARPWPEGRAWAYLVLAGVLDGAAYLLVYLGEERVTGGVAAVVYGTQPLILAVLLGATRMETLTTRHVAGAVVSLGGVALLFHDRLDVSTRQAAGVALSLGSVIVSTMYSMVLKRHGTRVPALVSTTIFLTVTAVVLGSVAIVAHEPLTWPPPLRPTLALVYLAVIGSAAAFLLYIWLLGHTSLVIASTLSFVYPLVALAVDAMFEGGPSIGPRAYLGVAITLGGLAITIRRG